MSTRTALKQLLKGNIHHMATVLHERPDQHDFWWKAMKGKASTDDWVKTLSEYRGGVDYPISFFYKEIMEAFPDAKILLNVRDPVKWYQSVKNSILKISNTETSWPCSWFDFLTGRAATTELVIKLSTIVPQCSTQGLGMFGAVSAGEKEAVQFWNEHVNEVKSVVPADRLLVWEVKEGWEPICKFLNVPVPQNPFPRVNDTDEIEKARKGLLFFSWFFIVFLPALLLLLAWYLEFTSPGPILILVTGYMAVIRLVKCVLHEGHLNHGKSD